MECDPFLYEVASARECFNEEIRYLIFPHGKEQAVDEQGLTWKFNVDNHCESIFLNRDGKYFRSSLKVWVDMDPNVWPKHLEDENGSEVELTTEEGEQALKEFKEKQKGLVQIDKGQLILYLMGDQQFAKSIGI